MGTIISLAHYLANCASVCCYHFPTFDKWLSSSSIDAFCGNISQWHFLTSLSKFQHSIFFSRFSRIKHYLIIIPKIHAYLKVQNDELSIPSTTYIRFVVLVLHVVVITSCNILTFTLLKNQDNQSPQFGGHYICRMEKEHLISNLLLTCL